MRENIFFRKKNIKLSKLFSNIDISSDFLINDIKPLHLAKKKDLTFFDSLKYKQSAINSVFECGVPEQLNIVLEKVLSGVGIIWNKTKALQLENKNYN